MQKNSRLVLSLLASGATSQVATSAVGLLRVPAIVALLGSEAFAKYAASMAIWSLFVVPGEVARQRLRQLSIAKAVTQQALKRTLLANILFSLTLISVFVGLIQLAGVAGIHFSGDADVFSLVSFLSILYVPCAGAVGIAEGKMGFSSIGNVTTVSQVLSLPLTYLGCAIDQPLLVAASSLVPFLAPGAYHLVRRVYRGALSDAKSQTVETKADFSFLIIILFHTLVYSLDTLIVLSIAGSEQAAEQALMQRIIVIFTMLPTMLGPLISVLHSMGDSKQTFNRIRLLLLGAGLAASLVLAFGTNFVVNLLTGGKIQIGLPLVIACITYGLAFCVCEPFISSATVGNSLRMRRLFAPIFAVISIGLDVLFVPIMGAAGAFYASFVGILVYAIGIRFGSQIQDLLRKNLATQHRMRASE